MFTPRREHARFCSARCRVAWNRLNASDTPAEGGALGWTITAMRETIDRLLRARGWDRPHARSPLVSIPSAVIPESRRLVRNPRVGKRPPQRFHHEPKEPGQHQRQRQSNGQDLGKIM